MIIKKTLLSMFLLSSLGLAACSGNSNMAARSWMTGLSEYAHKSEPAPEFKADSLAGNYLAGRYAQNIQDWDAAEHFMHETLIKDPANGDVLTATFIFSLGSGEYNRAVDLARQIMLTGQDKDLALLTLAVKALANKDYEAATLAVKSMNNLTFGELVEAWAFVGEEKYEQALSVLRKDIHAQNPLYQLHAGLIYEMTGDMDKAAELMTQALSGGLTTRSALLVGSFFERYDRSDMAYEVYLALYSQQPTNHFVNQAFKNFSEKGYTPKSPIGKPSDGAALGLFDLAAMLYENKAYDSALIYARLAQVLHNDDSFASVLIGDILNIYGHHDKALSTYNEVGKTSSVYGISRRRSVETLEMNGHFSEALGILSDMVEEGEATYDLWVQIGDIYRRNEQYDLAVKSYDEALAKFKHIQPEHWAVLFARGMSYERLNKWNKAEADLVKALEYQPDNPLVLNYLGYSWANMDKNLPLALDMIQRAVIMRPNDGYIIDSYGWVLYKLGYFDKAALLLEKSVELLPNDPKVNEHLGDAYWQTGRKLEAQFQWQRALNIVKDDKDHASLRKKLENGMAKLKTADDEQVVEVKDSK